MKNSNYLFLYIIHNKVPRCAPSLDQEPPPHPVGQVWYFLVQGRILKLGWRGKIKDLGWGKMRTGRLNVLSLFSIFLSSGSLFPLFLHFFPN